MIFSCNNLRINAVSIALHSLLVTAIFIDLVFMELTGNRGDNDAIPHTPTLPSSPLSSPVQEDSTHQNQRPTRRLVAFGILMTIYIVIKAYEVVIISAWSKFKKMVDELSLMVGGVALLALIYTTTIKFTYYVALPSYVILVVGRYVILGTKLHHLGLEFFYKIFLYIGKFIDNCKYRFAIKWASMKENMAYREEQAAAKNYETYDENFLAPYKANYNAKKQAHEEAIKAYEEKMSEWDTNINAAIARAQEYANRVEGCVDVAAGEGGSGEGGGERGGEGAGGDGVIVVAGEGEGGDGVGVGEGDGGDGVGVGEGDGGDGVVVGEGDGGDGVVVGEGDGGDGVIVIAGEGEGGDGVGVGEGDGGGGGDRDIEMG